MVAVLLLLSSFLYVSSYITIPLAQMRLHNVDYRTNAHDGLLQGIDDIKLASYYSCNLTASGISPKINVWDAVNADLKSLNVTFDEYIDSCELNFTSYLISQDFCDREEVVKLLDDEFSNVNGKFVIMSGGISIGKSLLMRNIATKHRKANDRTFILVDGRSAGETPNLLIDIMEECDKSNLLDENQRKRLLKHLLSPWTILWQNLMRYLYWMVQVHSRVYLISLQHLLSCPMLKSSRNLSRVLDQ
jgi:hypothetical protein